MYRKYTIIDYLDKLASREPVPGGGSAAALTGAIGAALLAKVANFTIGKEKYKGVEREIEEILKRAATLRENFLKLCSDDARVYKKLADVFKQPKTKERAKKLEDALKEAVAVPLEVCKNAHEAMRLSAPLAEKGNRNLISDTNCARLMLKCAYQTALLNVEINCKSIKDDKFNRETKKTVGIIEKEINKINSEIQKKVKGGIK